MGGFSSPQDRRVTIKNFDASGPKFFPARGVQEEYAHEHVVGSLYVLRWAGLGLVIDFRHVFTLLRRSLNITIPVRSQAFPFIRAC